MQTYLSLDKVFEETKFQLEKQTGVWDGRQTPGTYHIVCIEWFIAFKCIIHFQVISIHSVTKVYADSNIVFLGRGVEARF